MKNHISTRYKIDLAKWDDQILIDSVLRSYDSLALKILDRNIRSSIKGEERAAIIKELYNNSLRVKEKTMKKEGKCCLCGKPYTNYGNDIRPLVTSRGDRCCDDCNANIVVPNRIKFWDGEYYSVIYDKEREAYFAGEEPFDGDMYTTSAADAYRFKDFNEALNAIKSRNKQDTWVDKRIIVREDY